MNTQLVTIGILECVFAGMLTLVVIWLSYKILHRIVYKNLEPTPNNTAFAILAGSVVISIGMLLSEAIEPAMNTFRLVSVKESAYQVIALELIKTLSIYLGIALLAAVVINALGIWFFTLLTKDIDEWKEIRQQNIGVALLTGVMIVVLTLTLKHGVGIVFESWVPYPSTPRFY